MVRGLVGEVVVIVLAIGPILFGGDDDDDDDDNDNNDDNDDNEDHAFVSPLPPPPSLQKQWSLSTGE